MVAAAATLLPVVSVGEAVLPGACGEERPRKHAPPPSALSAVRPRPPRRRAGPAGPALATQLPSGGRGPWTPATSERGG